MTVRIAMWSGPRNLSTAMMRSFGARADTFVSDEPFYGAFLAMTGEEQPLGSETMAEMDCDEASVLRTISSDAPDGSPVWYQKHMPHHMVGQVSIEDMPHHRHAFLIRAPERVVASYAAKDELRDAELLGYGQIRGYVERERQRTGATPPIIDVDDVLSDPESVLSRLCEAVGIDWTPAMLSWDKGPHPADGVWGRHWYESVNASTGFAPPRGPLPDLEGAYADVAAACREDYEALWRDRIVP
ncbi:sulfotransferase family protein [Pacificimonas flava]|uniref:Sulfotransferase family protein n=2 Tax=Pacificimonas TaxID=1960290 RepID=A0A219B6Q8_9SPHN|nr:MULTISPECIES: HAD family hydrolase [Pacificimonas]MBZ6379328.1 HAD family hydrolase [Pacificimonas aurantium]OWV33468.1 sulfotransferase family protein [Pacificimonas flava]